MDNIALHLDEPTLNSLKGLIGTTWDSVGTSNMMIADLDGSDLVTCPALIACDSSALAFSIQDNEVFVGGDCMTLTILGAVAVGNSLAEARENGTLLFDGRGERVTAIHVIREDLTQVIEGSPRFHLSSDSGVILSLETMFIALQRRGLDGFDFTVRRATSFEDLEFHPTETDWPANSKVSFKSSRILIPIS